MSFIVTALGWLWHGFVYLYLFSVALDTIAFLAIAALGEKLRRTIAEHPLADEQVTARLTTHFNVSHRQVNLRLIVACILLGTLAL